MKIVNIKKITTTIEIEYNQAQALTYNIESSLNYSSKS